MKNIITEEDFLNMMRCSKAAYLSKNKPSIGDESKRWDIPERDEQVVDMFCNTLQPNGIKISKLPDGDEQVSKTRQTVESRTKFTLHRGVFRTAEGEVATVASLQKDNSVTAWALKLSAEQVFMDDVWPVAYQYYVLCKCGIHVDKIYIAYLNVNYVKEATSQQKLFIEKDVTMECRQLQREVAECLIRLRKVLQKKDEPFVPIGYHCPQPTCVFYKYCWANLDENSVFAFSDMSFAQKFRLYQHEYEKIEDVLEKERLTPGEQIQLYSHKNKKDYIDESEVSKFLKKCFKKGKGSFLDINVTQTLIPMVSGSTPSSRIPFQFSVLREVDRKIQTTSFTLNPKAEYDAMLEFVLNLTEALEPHETYPIIVWDSKAALKLFEDLSAWYPDLAFVFKSLKARLVSLQLPFQKKYFYSRFFGGRIDLWAILRVFITEEEYLDLAIQRSREAQRAFYKMRQGAGNEWHELKRNLNEYSKFKVNALKAIYSQLKLKINAI
jgi:hypothetical protein